MRILIPTRNRPTSLAGVLSYYERFYPKTEIIIADGSTSEFQSQNEVLVREVGISVDYRAYNPELSLFDRLLEVLKGESDRYIVMGADDDFPILETLEKCRKRLDVHDDCVCSGGFLVHLDVDEAGDARARLDPVRPIRGDTLEERMNAFSRLPFTTTYAVARRDLLIARYEFLREWNVPGFFDFGVAMMDFTHGKFFAIPELGFICTRNITHSYYRSSQPLVYLRRADDIMRLGERMSFYLREIDGLSAERAEYVVGQLINRRIAALAGAPPFRIAGFDQRPPFTNVLVTTARERFRAMFTGGTPERAILAERLAFIAQRLQETIESNDNAGDRKRYETLS